MALKLPPSNLPVAFTRVTRPLCCQVEPWNSREDYLKLFVKKEISIWTRLRAHRWQNGTTRVEVAFGSFLQCWL